MKLNARALLCLVITLGGCATTDSSLTGSAPGRVVWQYPKEAPSWILVPPESDGEDVHFLGVSGFSATETIAKQMAFADALNQVASYVGVNVTTLNSFYSNGTGKESDPLNATVTANVTTKLAGETFVNKGKQQWFFRRISKDGSDLFEARILFTLHTADIQLITDYLDEKQRSVVEQRRLSREASDKMQRRALEDIVKSTGVVVIGKGTSTGGRNRPSAEQAAIMAAKHDAYVKLNERFNGARIVGATTKDSSGSAASSLTVIQNGHVKAEVVSENVEWEAGTAIATVILRAM